MVLLRPVTQIYAVQMNDKNNKHIGINFGIRNTITLSCWTRIYPALANSVDPDQLASSEANWSGSALFAIQYLNLYQQPGSSNLIGWQLEVGVAS